MQGYKGAVNFVKLTQQPKCMINGMLQPHQIDSLNWMASLYELGLNGILADDMVSGNLL
jgi:SNF2 family DNA or RNA helicase